MITRHTERHHYDVEAELVLDTPPGHTGKYQPYLVSVDVASDRLVWRVITVGYAIEPHYGLTSRIVHEEWRAAALRTVERAAPLRDFLAAQGHWL